MSGQLHVVAVPTRSRSHLQSELEAIGTTLSQPLAGLEPIQTNLHRDGVTVPIELYEGQPGTSFVIVPTSLPRSLKPWKWPAEWKLLDDVCEVIAEIEIPSPPPRKNQPTA